MLKVTNLIVMSMLHMCWFIAQFKTAEEVEWIDPGDMIYYDHNTQTMKNRRDAESSDVLEAPTVHDSVANVEADAVIQNCQTENSQLKLEITALNQTVIAMKKHVSKCTALHEQAFFLQYVRALLERFKNLAAMDGIYQVDVKLTSEQYKYLEDYAINEKGSFQEVHSILLSMQQKSRWVTNSVDDGGAVWLNVVDYLTAAAQVVCTVGTILLLLAYCPRSVWWICSRLMIALFIVSIPWNWWHLYKEAVAAKRAELSETMPNACRPEHMSLWNVVVSLISIRDDECTRYYKNLEIDPMWKVTPLKAVSVTVVTFFLEPLEHFGKAVNKLVVSAYGGLPFYLWIPVSVVLIILIFVIFGYRLRTLVFSIEPHHGAPLQAAFQNFRELEIENHRMQELVESHQTQVAQLEMENRGLQELVEINQLRRADLETRLLLLTEGARLPQLTAGASERAAVVGELGEGDHSPPIDQEKYPVVCTDMLELSETSLQTAAAPDNDRVMSTDVDEISSDAASDFDHLSEL